ncbi:hypothetical protein PsorP6_017812 [Peronosclerospora sorghi]|uniref:Uncharacterized protein n=1 Tax=Peronosclerospora sorghi TaxID=230839 RepID=A0ACC0WEB6_9STRA|nr:hypothetical protein PsorP6_017812 [Peronosclerospora sorghi]
MLDERQAHARVPSSTHLALWLAMQKMVGTVLANRGRVALTDGHAHALVASLCASFEFSRQVNDAVAWRRELHGREWRYCLVQPRIEEDISSLLPQEVMGKARYLHVLSAVVLGGQGRADGARKDLARLIHSTVTEYLAWNGIHVVPGVNNEDKGGPEDAPQRVASFASLVVAMLMVLVKWTSDERHRTWLYPLLTHLVLVPDAAVRIALQTVFENVIGPLLPSPLPSNVE